MQPLPMGARGFLSLLFGAKIERRRRAGKKTLWSRQLRTSLPCDFETSWLTKPFFFVGFVCFRNLTCMHVRQWCVKRRVMLSNWGMANILSGVSITPVKRLKSVDSVYSVNNFCRVCNVNLLYNIWIWKVQLIRRCPFQRAKYSHKVVICAGMKSGRFAYGLFAYD